jgi:hypothetical protein
MVIRNFLRVIDGHSFCFTARTAHAGVLTSHRIFPELLYSQGLKDARDNMHPFVWAYI